MHPIFLLTSINFLNGNPIFWGNYTKIICCHKVIIGFSNINVSCHFFLSNPPENISKLLVFWCFQRYPRRPMSWNGLTVWLNFHENAEAVLQRCSYEKVFWKYPANLQDIYHPCRSVILLKLLSNFIEIILQYGCSPVNLFHILEHLVIKIPDENYFWKLNIYFWNLLGNPDIYTAWKVPAFRFIQVHIQDSRIQTRKTSNADTFNAVLMNHRLILQ